MRAKEEYKDDFIDQLLDLRGIKDPVRKNQYKLGNEERSNIVPPGLQDELGKFIQRKNLVVYGDYDADGITSIVSIVRILRDVQYICPERSEGYGLSREYLDTVKGKSVLTVDCGIRSKDLIDEYSDCIDFFVTDHHEPDPNAIPSPAINPKLYSTGFTDYSGSGVVLKSVGGSNYNMMSDMAAIGTIADVMPMLEENRAIVREGLRRLRQRQPAWLVEACRFYNLNINYLDEEDISFYIAPMINAAGRMGNVQVALDMLLSTNHSDQARYARDLIRMNEDRKKAIRSLADRYEKADQGERYFGENIVVLCTDMKDNGLIGLLAGEMSRRFDRAAVVFCDNGDDTLTGSMRSPDWFNSVDFVSKLGQLVITGGGHRNAAGLTISKKDKGEFFVAVSEADRNVDREISEELADIEISWYDAIGLLDQIESLAPYGNKFERPKFLSKVYIDRDDTVGSMMKKGHFSAEIHGYRALGFGMAQQFAGSGHYMVEYTIKRDTYKGANDVMAMISRMEKVS